MKKILFLSLSALFFISCNKEVKVSVVEPAFYYWRGNSSLDDSEVGAIKKMGVKKLYVKLFEVDYNEVQGNFPYEKKRLDSYEYGKLDLIKIVPVVFIKNGIFQYNNQKSLDQLADNIVFLLDKYQKEEYGEGKLTYEYDEIQIDCDWTKSTKDNYFYLLKKIKSLSGKQLSCTLRLYPYKYPDIMGVPPVDKAMLMCYNLIKPLSQKDKNSILDVNELKQYLNERKEYPVHLDVALPVFNWSQLYQNNRFEKLLSLTSKEIKTFAKEIKPLWYQVQRDTTIDYSTYLKAGDQIKCEEVSAQTIQEAIAIIKEKVVLDANVTISLFDMSQSTLKNYSHEEITSMYSAFTK